MTIIKIINSTKEAWLINIAIAEVTVLRWIFVMAGLVYFVDSIVLAQEVPMINDDPRIEKTLDTEMFDFISKTLGSGKLATHLQCTLKTRNSREQRRFSDSSQWVELLEIDFNSNGFDSGLKMKFKIPNTAQYGLRKTTNQWSGLGEEIKIELGDRYGHWIKFAHDGQGRILQLIMGNDLRTVPCYSK